MKTKSKLLWSSWLLALMAVFTFSLSGHCAKKDSELLNDKLLSAAASGTLAEIKELLAKGADVNAKGQYEDTPLIKAAMRGDLEIVKFLLSKGALLEARNQYGYTPLLAAVENKRTEVANFLIAQGADINVGNYCGVTPLIFAARNADIDLVKLLLAKGANVNAKDCDGRTALFLTEMLEPLPYKNDWPEVKTTKLKVRGGPRVVSPEERALREEIKGILLQHGAKSEAP